MKNVAIILSGGVGSRFGAKIPKQFTKLAGKSIIEYTIQTFENSPLIDEIIVVSNKEYVEKTWDIIHRNNWKKISKVLVGGKERFDSSYSALTALIDYPEDTKVIFHDAVRPLVSTRTISNCIHKLDTYKAVDVAIPSADTIVEIDENNCIKNIPNRSMMRRGQTPQAFHLKTLRTAYLLAKKEAKYSFTCDCGVVREMLPDTKIAIVEASERNIKITHPIDLFIAEKFIQSSEKESIDYQANFSDLNQKVIVIFGGSSGIGKSISDIAQKYGAKVYIASRSHNNINIRNKNHIESFLEQVNNKEGKINYIVNTVGLLIKKPLTMLSYDEIDKLVSINYTGAIHIAIASKPYLEKSSGMLLNFTSSSYTRGRAYYAIYSSANAGIVNFTQALSDEWLSNNIKVNCINPERTATPMRTSNFGQEDPTLLLSPEDVAHTSIATLLSDKTGIIVDVRKDGY